MIKFDAAKALESTVVLLAGDEGALRKRAMDELLELASGGDDFDVEQFSGDSSSPVDWFASAGTSPFLSPRRVAVVRNVLRHDLESELVAILPSTALVLLVADEEGGGDERETKWDSRARKWEAAVKKAKGSIHIFKVEPREVIDTLRADAKNAGKTLSPVAAERLSEMCGGSLSRAMDELGKLVLFVGNAPAISEKDVEDIVVPSREWKIFKMIDCLIKGDAAGSLKELRVMVGGNSKAEGVAFGTIFPMVSRQLRLIWQARAVLDAAGGPTNIPTAVSSYFPSRPNLAGEKEYPRKLAFEFARKLSLTQVQRAIQIVADTDGRMKGLLPAFSTADSLERMVLELVEALRTVRRAA